MSRFNPLQVQTKHANHLDKTKIQVSFNPLQVQTKPEELVFFNVPHQFQSPIGINKTFGWDIAYITLPYVSIPYRYKQNHQHIGFYLSLKLVSIPYRYKQNWAPQSKAKKIILVSIPYRYKQNHSFSRVLPFKGEVSIPYRYKQNIPAVVSVCMI